MSTGAGSGDAGDPVPTVDLSFSLAGKVAVVTGGASGIGAAIATAFVARGARVAVLDRDLAAARTRAVELGGDSFAVEVDVAVSASVDAAVQTVVDTAGRLDVLVNCAGLARLSPAEDLGDDLWATTIAVNLTGTFLMSRAAGRHMLAAGNGRVINLASQAATVALPEHAAYSASKAGVVGLTKVLALEWGGRGVTANTISPTVVLTDLGRAVWSGERGERARAAIPTGRFALPEEVAGLAVYLASPAAAMVNGADYLIDGGFTIA